MSKAEFLSGLRKALEGNISESSIQSNIAYYDSYIAEEVQKGSTEEEVLNMLGDPWVIARTIIEAEDGTDQESVYEATGKQTYSNSSGSERRTEKVYKVDEWWKKLLLILTIVMIVVVVIAIVTGLIRLFAPVLIPILVVLLIVRLFERRR